MSQINELRLDLSPAYIPFTVQCTKADGTVSSPTVDSLIIYEELGANAVFDTTQITGSPFDPAIIDGQVGLWGVLIDKTLFTAGRYYHAYWEMTVDSITTAKSEWYFATNASQFKATGFSTHSAADVKTAIEADGSKLDAVYDKLPTNYLMGSSDVDNHDTDIDSILVDTGTTLENHLTDLKGTGFVKDTDSLKNLAHIGADGDTLETLSDQIDVAQADLDNPSQYKADVSGLAIEGNIETHVTTAINSYDPPTRTEATADKDAIIAQVDANETKIDTIIARIGAITGSGWNTILGFFRALMRKDVGVTLPTDIGGTFDNTTDSVEAIADTSVSVDLTPVTNALTDLQTDLGNPSADATTIYAQVLVLKGYVDDLESRLSATRAGYLDNLSGGAVALNSTVAKENTLNTLITDIKGTGFVKDTDSLVNLSHKAGTKGTDAIYDKVDIIDIIGSGTNTITITVYEHGGTTPINEYNISFYNSDLSIIYGTLQTDSLGQITTNINDGTYKLKGHKFGYTPDNTTETFVVSPASLTKTIYATPISPSIPDIGIQTLYGYVADLGLNPSENYIVEATINNEQDVGGVIITKLKLTDIVNSNGYFELGVAKGSEIIVTILNTINIRQWHKRITVTNSDTKDISTY